MCQEEAIRGRQAASMTEMELWKPVEVGAAWSEVVGWGLAETADEGDELPGAALNPPVPQAAPATGIANARHIRTFLRLGEFIRAIMCPHSNCRFARR